LDKAKRLLGLHDEEPAQTEPRRAAVASEPRAGLGRGASRTRGGRERPPLPDEVAPPSQGLDEVLAARDTGDIEGSRAMLRDIDRGGGLRTVIRAAAALEAGDEDELAPLLPAIAAEKPQWKLVLELASAIDDPQIARAYLERAAAAGAPAWAVAWARARSHDEIEQREGLVELLFSDPALARTVAARDLSMAGTEPDAAAAQRYASLSHGREVIRRFGARLVARVVDRAMKER
jgi:hypothetical protein